MIVSRRALFCVILGLMACVLVANASSSRVVSPIEIGDGRALGIGGDLGSSRSLGDFGVRGDEARLAPGRGEADDAPPVGGETPRQSAAIVAAPGPGTAPAPPLVVDEGVAPAPPDPPGPVGEPIGGAVDDVQPVPEPQEPVGVDPGIGQGPAPEPAQPPEPAPVANILFSGDSLSKFVVQAKAGRVTSVEPGSFRFETRPGDYLSASERSYGAARSEVYIDTERWPEIAAKDTLLFYSGSFTFEPGWDMDNPSAWRTILQFKHNDESGAPFDFYAQGSAGLRYGSVDGPKIADIEVGKPYPWLLEAVWSEDPALALQRVYLFGVQVAEGRETVKSGDSIYPKFGLYMSEKAEASAIRHSDFLVGTSRAAVGY